MCDLVILMYTTVKLMYIRFGEDFTGWLPNDWFGSLICKGIISKRINQSLTHIYVTRGSKFLSSKVRAGGESRKAYACRLTFDPAQFLFEINDYVTQFVRKPTFDPLLN